MEQIRYVNEDHSYWIGDVQLESVTNFIKSLSPPFDKDAVSKHCAAKDGVTQEEIIKQWEYRGNAARERGIAVHSYIDDVLNETIDPFVSMMNVKIPEMTAFDAAWESFKTKAKAKVVRREFIIGDAALGIAGRVDVMLQIEVNDIVSFCLFDWKTGKFNQANQFAKLLSPFNKEPDCELAKYSLQLSLYRLILQRKEPELNISNCYLVHLKEDSSFQIHKTTDYRLGLESHLLERKKIK